MLKRLSLYTFLLCLVPIFTWILGWQWHDDTHLTRVDYYLYWLTETGSTPWAIISCALLALAFRPIFPSSKKWILGVVVMALSMVVTQGIKSVTKTIVAEPRPYVIAMAEQSVNSTASFYGESRDKRALLVEEFYDAHPETPSWVRAHRVHETGYSFPSGHAIFVAAWLMLAVGFTEIYGRCKTSSKWLVAGVFIWAILMLVSRLRLGMHYPIDLFASILIAWLVHMMLFAFLQKKAIFIKDLHPKCR